MPCVPTLHSVSTSLSNRLFIQRLAPFPFHLLSLLFIIRPFPSTTTFIFKARRSGSVLYTFISTSPLFTRRDRISFTIFSRYKVNNPSQVDRPSKPSVSLLRSRSTALATAPGNLLRKISNCRNYEVQQQRRSRSTIPLQHSCAATQGTPHASEAP